MGDEKRNELQIKRVMELKNVKAVELAKMLGKSKQYVSNVVNGRANVSLDVLREFATVLGVKPYQLLLGAPVLQEDFVELSGVPQEANNEQDKIRKRLKDAGVHWHPIREEIKECHPKMQSKFKYQIIMLNEYLLGEKVEDSEIK